MDPLVSILIPAYNAGDWIAEALKSALAQTWPRTEIIVVDDGSQDQTASIARQFSSKNVAVVSQANQGAAVARNKAYSLCQGDYIQWLDADDILAPQKIERQMIAMREAPSTRTLLAGPWGYFAYRIQKTQFKSNALWCDLTPLDWLLRKMGQNLHMSADAWLVTREITEAAGPWDVRLFKDNDGEYFCRVIMASDRILFVPEAKSYYRSAGFKSVSHIGRSDKKMESLCLSMHLHVGYIRSLEDSERVRAACLEYLNTNLIDFCLYRPDLVERLQQLAASLGGRLDPPKLSWKYALIKTLLGSKLMKDARLVVPKVKCTAHVSWDRALFQLQNLLSRRSRQEH